MFNKKITVKLLSVLLVVTLMFSVSLPLTASAIVAGEDTPQEFRYLTLEEMQELSQAELVQYCREFYAHEFPEVTTTVNPEDVDPNQINPLWGSDYRENKDTHYGDSPAPTATHCYFTIGAIIQLGFNADITKMSPVPYNEKDMMTLAEYSEYLDFGENDDFSYKGHFFDPTTNMNYKDDTDDTAKTNFLSHYKSAEYYLKNGNREYAMQELGKALHYLQDANESHHANNKTAPEDFHGLFEDWVGRNFENIGGTPQFNADTLSRVRNYTPEGLIIKAAFSGYNNFDLAKKWLKREQAAEILVPSAISNTAYTLYYFAYKNDLTPGV